jgi:hypothetical protein
VSVKCSHTSYVCATGPEIDLNSTGARRVVPYRLVPYRLVPYRLVPYRLVPYRLVPYRLVPYRLVPYRLLGLVPFKRV